MEMNYEQFTRFDIQTKWYHTTERIPVAINIGQIRILHFSNVKQHKDFNITLIRWPFFLTTDHAIKKNNSSSNIYTKIFRV